MHNTSIILSLILALTVLSAPTISATVIKKKEAARRPHTTKPITAKYVKFWLKRKTTSRRRPSKPRAPKRPINALPRDARQMHTPHQPRHSHHALHKAATPQTNKWRKDPWFRREKIRIAKVMSPRADSIYVDSATLVPLPDQPASRVRLLLSVILQNSALTNAVLQFAVNCLANGTDTSSNNWGAYNADRFTPELVQVEFYALLDESAVQSFSGTVDQYIQNNHLTQCLQSADVGFDSQAAAFAARVVTAPGATVVSEAGGAPAWAIGIAIGVAAIAGIAALVITAFRGDGDDDKSDLGDDAEDVESGYPAQFIDLDDPDVYDDVGQALEAISGPEERAMVSAAPH